MLACGIAAQLAKRITHGSIYTTKLLRRGIDIERPKATAALQSVKVQDAMQPIRTLEARRQGSSDLLSTERPAVDRSRWERLVGPVTLSRRPQTLFAEEDLEQARRQLILYGRDGLPVVSRHGQLLGWLTRADVLRALTGKLSSSEDEIEDGAAAAEFAVEDPIAAIHTPSTPLRGYEILEPRIFTDSPARGRHVARH
jgi:CIC family chloride channel protein